MKRVYHLLKVGNEVYGGHEVDQVIWLCSTANYTTIKLTDGRVITTTAPPDENFGDAP